MGSNADGTPADSSVLQEQKGAASQSNAFTPVSTAPLAAAAIQQGMVDEGLTLVEATADVVVNRVKAPWNGQLFFDSRTGRCFYGLHYSDYLILWDVMYALLGAQVDVPQRSLRFAPPRVPAKIPLFGKLYTGQVEFSLAGSGVELRLTNFADEPTSLRTLTVRLPKGTARAKCTVQQGAVGAITAAPAEDTVCSDVLIPPKGVLRLRWEQQGK